MPFLNRRGTRNLPLCKPVLTVDLRCDWLQQSYPFHLPQPNSTTWHDFDLTHKVSVQSWCTHLAHWASTQSWCTHLAHRASTQSWCTRTQSLYTIVMHPPQPSSTTWHDSHRASTQSWCPHLAHRASTQLMHSSRTLSLYSLDTLLSHTEPLHNLGAFTAAKQHHMAWLWSHTASTQKWCIHRSKAAPHGVTLIPHRASTQKSWCFAVTWPADVCHPCLWRVPCEVACVPYAYGMSHMFVACHLCQWQP